MDDKIKPLLEIFDEDLSNSVSEDRLRSFSRDFLISCENKGILIVNIGSNNKVYYTIIQFGLTLLNSLRIKESVDSLNDSSLKINSSVKNLNSSIKEFNESSDKSSNRMFWLTIVILGLTVVMAVLTWLMLTKM